MPVWVLCASEPTEFSCQASYSQSCPLPPVEGVLQELWQDPDPATAVWALWRLRHHNPELASLVLRQPRLGLLSVDRLAVLLDPADSTDPVRIDLEERLLELLREDALLGHSIRQRCSTRPLPRIPD